MSEEPGRRSLVAMLLVYGALTIAVVGASLIAKRIGARPGHWNDSPREAHSSHRDELDPRMVAYLGPIAETRRFEAFRVTRLDPLQFGRITLELEGQDGARFVLDLHARSEKAPSPIAETEHVAIYARTGKGQQTPAAVMSACADLAKALRAREQAGQLPPPLEPLMLH